MSDTEQNRAIGEVSPLALDIKLLFPQIGAIVGAVNVNNGWDRSRDMIANPDAYPEAWKTTHKIAELGLIATEVAEAIEEVRGNHAMDESYYPRRDYIMSHPEAEWTSYPEYVSGIYKPEGVPSELADVMIRVFDLADAYGIDLAGALIEKINHNATRGLHHGGKSL